MFEIKLDSAEYWRDCLEAIVSLVEEGSFNISKEGISLRAMDPSGISMVSFNIPSKAFSKFTVSDPVSIGLNLSNLSKIMQRTRPNEALVMKDSDNKLSLEFSSDSGKRKYKIPLIDIRKNADKEPTISFDVHAEVMSEPMKNIIKDAAQMSSYISFKAAKNQFIASAYGDSGELEGSYEEDGKVIKKIDAAKNAQAVFNLEYLENIVKGCPVGSEIDLSLKSDDPLKLSYKIHDAEITYYLAPYMES